MSNIGGGALPPQSEYWGGWSPPAPPAPTPLKLEHCRPGGGGGSFSVAMSIHCKLLHRYVC